MTELSLREQLQPSLLDRLTDHEPHKTVESRDQRTMSVDKLRQYVLRDLGWLLNTGNLSQIENLDEYPEAKHSVVNYGTPDLSGRVISSTDIPWLEESMRRAVWNFEPRILRQSVRVQVIVDETTMGRNSLTFQIEGTLWAQPMPIRLLLKTEVDLETGHVEVVED